MARLQSLCALLLIFAGACTERATFPVSFVLRGQIKFSSFGLPYPSGAFGGNVQIVAYADNDEGYCLEDAHALLAAGFNVLVDPDPADLAAGIPYELTITEGPGVTYPFDIHPVALWQHTSSQFHACETGGVFNAMGYYGAEMSYQTGPTSACCGFRPAAVTVTQRGAVLDNVDLLMIPQAPPNSPCLDPNADSDVCLFRHPPGSTVGDSACYQALGARADELFVRRDASDRVIGPCP